MLTTVGLPLLVLVDDALEELQERVLRPFQGYLGAWRQLLGV